MGGRGSSATGASGSYDGTVSIPYTGLTVNAMYGGNIKVGDSIKLSAGPAAPVMSVTLPTGRSKIVTYKVINPMTGKTTTVKKKIDELVGVE